MTSQDGSTSESLMIKDFGVYWLTVSNACGHGIRYLDFFTATIRRPGDTNIITPNGDLLNQNFVIEKEIGATNHLKVYNRWGEEVYSSDDYKNDWDGDGLPSGV